MSARRTRSNRIKTSVPLGKAAGFGLALSLFALGSASRTYASPAAGPAASAPVACLASTCEQARQSDAFADSIGFDVPIYWARSFDAMVPLLHNAGIRHARVGLCLNQVQCAFYQKLLRAGVHGTVIMGTNSTASQIAQALAPNGDLAEGAFIEAMEGINEPNNPGLPGYSANWIARTRSAQQMLWNTVKSSPRAKDVTVLGPSICCNSKDQAAIGDLTPYLDVGNQHVYFGQQNPGAIYYTGAGVSAFNRQLQRAISGSKIVHTTETGWGTLASDPASGVSPSTQQRFTVRNYLENFSIGIRRTFNYVFADDPSAGAAYGSYGIVAVNGSTASLTPKATYYAVANLLSVVADPGPPFAPTRLSYKLSGDASSVDHLLLQKRDGSFYLVLWMEVPGWNRAAGAAISYPPQRVTIESSTPLWAAETFSYDPKGTGAISRAKLDLVNNSATVSLTDQATIVHLVPRSTPTTQSAPDTNPGYTNVTNANSGMCFFVVNASLDPGTAIMQNTCTSGRNEQFTVARQPDGFYLLRDNNSRNCIAEVGSGAGSPVRTVAKCSAADPSQEFALRQLTQTAYALINRQSNLCIDVPGRSTIVGAQMQVQGCNGSRSQLWAMSHTQ